MYITYFYLFSKMFVDRYIRKCTVGSIWCRFTRSSAPDSDFINDFIQHPTHRRLCRKAHCAREEIASEAIGGRGQGKRDCWEAQTCVIDPTQAESGKTFSVYEIFKLRSSLLKTTHSGHHLMKVLAAVCDTLEKFVLGFCTGIDENIEQTFLEDD